MQQKPGRLPGDAQNTMDIQWANASLRVGNHPDCNQPLIQTYRAIFHDSSGFNREILLAVLAYPEAASLDETGRLAAATRAGNTIRPAQPDHKAQAIIRVGEVLNRRQ